MAIYVYNTKQQELNSKKLAELFSFASNDFCGLISSAETPIDIDISNNSWDWSTGAFTENQIKLMGGGVNIAYEKGTDTYPKFFNFDNSTSGIYGFDITIPDTNASILTNSYQNLYANLRQVACSNIELVPLISPVMNPSGNPNEKGYYELTSVITESLPIVDAEVRGVYTVSHYIKEIVSITYDGNIISNYSIDENDTTYRTIKINRRVDTTSGVDTIEVVYRTNGPSYVLSPDTSIIENKKYYYALENNAFRVIGAKFDSEGVTFDYYGNTVWISKPSNRFFIPICGKSQDGTLYSMIFNRDKEGYESFLTARTYYQLIKDLGDQFVWRVGGETLGDIGDLNITDNIIKNKSVNTGVEIVNPIFNGKELDTKSYREYSGTKYNVDNILSNVNLNKVLLVDEDNNIKVTDNTYKIPISHGGTGGGTPTIARKNLNILYGEEDPNEANIIPYRLTLATDTDKGKTKDYGALYFKIL